MRKIKNKIKNKKKPKAYELVPLRTRIRMYARKIFTRSKKKISYAVMDYRVRVTFGIGLKELDIKKKDIVKLSKRKRVLVSRKDERYEAK